MENTASRFTISTADILNAIMHDLRPVFEAPAFAEAAALEYWSFDRCAISADEETAIRAEVTDGSEGTWINLYAAAYNRERQYIGCVKTLDASEDAWAAMGALAGRICWRAEKAIWAAYIAHVRKAREQ